MIPAIPAPTRAPKTELHALRSQIGSTCHTELIRNSAPAMTKPSIGPTAKGTHPADPRSSHDNTKARDTKKGTNTMRKRKSAAAPNPAPKYRDWANTGDTESAPVIATEQSTVSSMRRSKVSSPIVNLFSVTDLYLGQLKPIPLRTRTAGNRRESPRHRQQSTRAKHLEYGPEGIGDTPASLGLRRPARDEPTPARPLSQDTSLCSG
jgi:hypothetical protein